MINKITSQINQAFNLLSRYKNELKAFQNIQKTYVESPVREKRHTLLSFVGAGLIKKVYHYNIN